MSSDSCLSRHLHQLQDSRFSPRSILTVQVQIAWSSHETSARVSQREQRQSNDGKQRDRRLQTLLGLKLRVFNAASRLQGFMIL